jgi:hypothetical protein
MTGEGEHFQNNSIQKAGGNESTPAPFVFENRLN